MNPETNVNFGVDTILRLMVLSGFEVRPRDLHRIRILQVGGRCEVLDTLKKWAQDSPVEYKRVRNKLRKIAEEEKLPLLGTIKRVGRTKRIVQIEADNARLYCFQDDDKGYTFVCTNSFWIGRGNKKKNQNLEIEEAERLMELWQQAEPVPRVADTRISRARGGRRKA